jgi:hypothetical protein
MSPCLPANARQWWHLFAIQRRNYQNEFRQPKTATLQLKLVYVEVVELENNINYILEFYLIVKL